MASKPSRLLDWVTNDDAGKFTVPDGATQLAGHISGTNADGKLFNWTWNRCSKWIEYLDELELNQIPDSSDYKKVKTEDLTSNRVDFDKLNGVNTTKTEVNQLNTSGAILADFTKLHAITADENEINQLNGVSVGGSSSGDIDTIDDTQTLTNKTIDADSNTVSNLEHGAEVDNPTSAHGVTGNIVGTESTQALLNKSINAVQNTITNLEHGSEVDDPITGVHGVGASNVVGTSTTQTLTNKTIDADNNTVSNLEHGSEVDNLTTSHGATGAIVGTTNTQTLTNKRLTSPKINEDVVLSATSSHLNRLAQSTYGLSITNSNTTDHGINIPSITSNKDCINITANPGTTGSGIVMDFSSAGGTGMKILNTSFTGIVINTTGTHGISAIDTTQNGIRLDNCGGIGYDSVRILNQSNYGIQIGAPDGSHGHIRLIGVASDPSTTEEGSIYYNSTAHTIVYYNGTAWKTLATVA